MAKTITKHSFLYSIIVLIMMGVLIAFGPGVIVNLIKSPKALAAWFDDSFYYRQTVSFTHNADITSDRRVNLTINTSTLVSANKMQSSCNDTRFTDPSGKVLRFQLVSGCNGASTSYDIILPKIYNGANFFYIYYGNPNALSASVNVADVTSLTPSGGAASMATEEQPPSPVAYWKFDEGTGTTANDGTSNKNNGTLTLMASPPTATSGWQTEDVCISGKCVRFDGSNDYVTAGNGNSVKITGALSISAWVKLTTNNSVHDIVSKKGASGQFGYRLYTDANGKLNMEVSSDGTALTTVGPGSTTLSSNTWYHVAGTYNPSTTMVVYINGLSDATNSSSIPASIFNSSASLEIGSENGGSATNIMSGTVDEVKVYNYVRTAAQIKLDYNAGLAKQVGSKGAGVAFGSQAASTNALNNGLVGYWKMDESLWNGTAGEVKDSSGNTNNGVRVGDATTTGTNAKFGRSGTFDGVGDYVNVPSSSSLQITDNITLAAWIRPTAIPAGDGGIVRKNGEYSLRLINTGAIGGRATGCTGVSSNTVLSINTWYHVAWTYDESVHKIYVNGVLDNSFTESCNIPTGTGDVLIATEDVQTNGIIDEARIYNRILSPAEISQLYNFAPGPVGYWKLDEGSGTTANDSSGYGNDGTITPGTGGYISGQYGKAYLFDAADTKISAGSASSVDDIPSGAGLSISTWLYTKSNGEGNAGRIIQKNDGGSNPINGWQFNVDSSSRFTFRAGFAGAAQDLVVTTTDTFTANKWQHISLSWDGTINAKAVHIYINGVEAAYTTQTAGTGTYRTDGAQTLLIGNSNSNARTFDGYIDDMRLYNYPRTPSQIIEDLNGGHPMGGSPVSSMQDYWKLDEGQGTTANSAGIQKTAGTLTNMSSPASVGISGWLPAGKFGKGVAFDGVNDFVDFGDLSYTESVATMSATFWVNPNALATQRCLLCKWQNTAAASKESWAIETGSSNSNAILVEISINGNASQATAETPSGALAVGVWTHVAVVYDTSQTPPNSNAVKIYINGILQTNTISGTFPNVTQATTSNLRAGTSSDATPARLFSGQMDEIKIYSGALTRDQVLIDMNRGSTAILGALSTMSSDGKTASQAASAIYCIPGDTTTCTAPVGEWKFEEGTGTTANDYSGNGNSITFGKIMSWTSGKYGKATHALSDGTFNNAGSINSVFTIKGSSEVTISLWAYINAYPGSSQGVDLFMEKVNDTGATRLDLAIVNNQSNCSGANVFKMSFRVGDSTSTKYNVCGTTTLKLNTWYYLTGIFNSTTGIHRLYLNGVPEASLSQAVSAFPNTNPSGADPVALDFNGTGSLWDIKMDDFKVYNYARTPAQIAWDYNQGKPAAWYKLDECQGTTGNDASQDGNGAANANNLTINIDSAGTQTSPGNCNTASTAWKNGVSGRFNYSLNFDGNDDHATSSAFSPLATATQTTTKASWGGWFYPTSSAASESLMEKLKEFRLTTDSNSKPICDIYTGGAQTSNTAGTNSVALTLNSWNHLLCTYDGTTIKMYLNGVQTDSWSQTGSITAISTALHVAQTSSSTQRYSGQIDDLKIWNYDLTSVQAKNEYNQAGAVRFGPNTGAP